MFSERGWENSRHLCKPETKSRVCITVENSPNPSSDHAHASGYCKQRKKVFYCFYKITSSKNYNPGKDKKINFLDEKISSYNIDMTMGFLNWPITFWKSGGGVFTTCVSLRHTTMFTYSHANTPLGQSECAYYLTYFIIAVCQFELARLPCSPHLSLRGTTIRLDRYRLCHDNEA